MQQQITDTMLWPRRVVCPATRDGMVNDTVLSPQKLDELSRDDPLLRAFAARDTYSWNNAPTFKKARGKARTGQDESAGDTPGFNINLGVLDFQGVASAVNEFNWTQQLQARATPPYHAAPLPGYHVAPLTTPHTPSHATPLLTPHPSSRHTPSHAPFLWRGRLPATTGCAQLLRASATPSCAT